MTLELDQLAAALSAAQGEFEAVAKTETNPFFKSKYAGLPDVIKTASPILAKHGLAVSQLITWNGEYDCLTTILMHKSGQCLRETMRLHLTKDDPQGQGSAVTYARRYAYMAALGLVADEDDDGNAASRQSHPAQQQRRRPPPQVAEISPKRRLLAACAGDKEMAERLWQEAFQGRQDGPELSDTELQLLLSRAEAEMNAGDGRPL